MIASMTLAIASVIASVLVHYEALRLLSRVSQINFRNPRTLMLVVMFGVFVAHLIEIAVYAGTYWVADAVADVGSFTGNRAIDAMDYFYFSAESFTSLGMGDIYPLGDLRLISGVEVLNGLLLIAWSASFTYLIMERFWRLNGTTNDHKET